MNSFPAGVAGERPPLSPREAEVVALLAAHLTAKEIAAELDIGVGTANGYIASARSKWLARDRNELARLYLASVADSNAQPGPAPTNDRGQIRGGDNTPPFPTSMFADLPTTTTFAVSDVLALDAAGIADTPPPLGLEALDSRFGRAWRIAAIPLLALALAAAGLCIAAIAVTLS